MNTYARKVGRLVEIRVKGAYEPGQFGRVIGLANELGSDAKVVLLVDARESAPLSPEQSKKVATAQLGSRERIAKVVSVVKATAVTAMVMQRVRTESGLEHATTFSIEEALAALGPVLNAAELARARQFLAET